MDIRNSKIIWCHKSDIALYWVHNLTQNKRLYIENDNHEIYYSDLFDVFFFYYKGTDDNETNILSDLMNLTNQFNNHVHAVFCDFRCVDNILTMVDNVQYISYSVLNHMGEMIYDTQPRNINNLKNINYYFSCSDLFNKDNITSEFQNTNKFIKDYKYSLTYFYFKYGYNFIQKGEHIIKNNVPKNNIFLYTKSKKDSQRENLIKMISNNSRIISKEFDDTDRFWFGVNNHSVHTSFLIDYNICKFNIIMETQPLQKQSNILSNFCSEKTLKSLMVPTPSYVVMQEDVYNQLKDFGFYFLNQEFGEYNFSNYIKFCNFLNDCTQTDFDILFEKSFQSSKLNKHKIEEYIYSDKEYEIKLLTNKH